MNPIHDSAGSVIAWIHEDVVYNLGGAPVAFVRNGSVIGFGGAHLGRFDQGHFRDHAGGVVAFTEGAIGGPLKPVRAVTPVWPVRGVVPVRPVAPVAPVRPVDSLGWSSSRWTDFLMGRA
jgi:hypothetical protein